jgi:hypothetical protein
MREALRGQLVGVHEEFGRGHLALEQGVVVVAEAELRVIESDWGTPIISAITRSGSSAATSVTKSQWPLVITWSTMSRVISRTCGSRFRSMRGVNVVWTSLRYFQCVPGGMVIRLVRNTSASSGVGSRKVIPCVDDAKVFWSSEIAWTSL